MKTATQNLEHDHKYILQLIDVMHIMVSKKTTNTEDIEKVIWLIRNYADGFHHAKEEDLLFPSMKEKGFSAEEGPIAVMLSDHTQGRAYVKNMELGLQKYLKGDKESITSVYESMTAYGQLLQNHIAKENNVLFRMADKVLSPTDQENLLMEFEKIEHSEAYSSNISDYMDAINKLKMLYN